MQQSAYKLRTDLCQCRSMNSPVSPKRVDGLDIQSCIPVEGHRLKTSASFSFPLLYLSESVTLTFLSAWPCWGSTVLAYRPRTLWAAQPGWGERSEPGWRRSGCVVWNEGSTSSWNPLCYPASVTPKHTSEHLRLLACIVTVDRVINYINGEIVVIGDGEISQLPEVHVPSADSVHDEDIRGKPKSSTCRLKGEKHKELTENKVKLFQSLCLEICLFILEPHSHTCQR